MEKKKRLRRTTKQRHEMIARAVKARLGTMPVMMVYAQVGEEMGLSEDTIRRVMWQRKR